MRIATIAFAWMTIVLGASSACASPAAPVLSISTLGELNTPLPYPYDSHADADAEVNAALATAKSEHKRAFIDLGGNWCAECRILAGIMELPEMKPFVDKHYVVVEVDVGRFNRNLQIPARWGITDRLSGLPAVLIVDPSDNSLIDRGHIAALADARAMTPQAIGDWLAQWAK